MRLFNHNILAQLVHEAPERTGQTIRRVAERMGGIDQKYLARQINPDDAGAKMGMEDFVYFSAVTDLVALDYLVATFDSVRIPIPTNNEAATEDPNWLKHIARVTKEAAEAVSKLAESISDGNFSEKERRECLAETYDALQVLGALWVDIKGRGQ